jgi:hypothetical protein
MTSPVLRRLKLRMGLTGKPGEDSLHTQYEAGSIAAAGTGGRQKVRERIGIAAREDGDSLHAGHVRDRVLEHLMVSAVHFVELLHAGAAGSVGLRRLEIGLVSSRPVIRRGMLTSLEKREAG